MKIKRISKMEHGKHTSREGHSPGPRFVFFFLSNMMEFENKAGNTEKRGGGDIRS